MSPFFLPMLRWCLAPRSLGVFHPSLSCTTTVRMSLASSAAYVNCRWAPKSCMWWGKQSEAKTFRTVMLQSASTNPAAMEEPVSGMISRPFVLEKEPSQRLHSAISVFSVQMRMTVIGCVLIKDLFILVGLQTTCDLRSSSLYMQPSCSSISILSQASLVFNIWHTSNFLLNLVLLPGHRVCKYCQ